jgi:SAM-dependent methyltransferase
MAEFHFVEDYERHVANLIANYPLDEAMSLAVGGGFELVGAIEVDILRFFGLEDGMSLIDLGCGSGRLASALGRSAKIEYTGIDIVQILLDYAKSKSPSNYSFILHRALSIPSKDCVCEFVTAFSVFTHLLPAESYIYLEDIKRVLKPNGKLVFSFLEFGGGAHWDVFDATVTAQRYKAQVPLNSFIERSVIGLWCDRLGYKVESYVSATEAPWGSQPLGQSIVVLGKL